MESEGAKIEVIGKEEGGATFVVENEKKAPAIEANVSEAAIIETSQADCIEMTAAKKRSSLSKIFRYKSLKTAMKEAEEEELPEGDFEEKPVRKTSTLMRLLGKKSNKKEPKKPDEGNKLKSRSFFMRSLIVPWIGNSHTDDEEIKEGHEKCDFETIDLDEEKGRFAPSKSSKSTQSEINQVATASIVERF